MVSGMQSTWPAFRGSVMNLVMVRARPQVVDQVWISMECPLETWLLAALRLFPRLRRLDLACEESYPLVPLDVPLLCGLPHLATLRVERWENARFTQPFTALTELFLLEVCARNSCCCPAGHVHTCMQHCRSLACTARHVRHASKPTLMSLPPAAAWQVAEVVVDTELPSLLSLAICNLWEALVLGEQLRLPQLTYLELCGVEQAELDWAAVPRLERALLDNLDYLEWHDEGSFSSLTRLSFLDLWSSGEGSDEAVQKMAGLLRLAPPSLRSMRVRGWSTNGELAALAACGAQLTRLQCMSPEVVPALGPLRQLEELEVCATAAQLAEHCTVLGGLTGLRKLTCREGVPQDEMKGADWKVRWHAAWLGAQLYMARVGTCLLQWQLTRDLGLLPWFLRWSFTHTPVAFLALCSA